MITKNTQRGLAALTLAALMGLPSTGALADSTSEEIRLLKARLHQLELREAARDREERQAGRVHGSNAMVVKGPLDNRLPDRFYFKGVSIVPGGFFAMETVYRNHWMGSDMTTGWAAIPLGLTAAGQTDETRFSARQSRLSLLVQGDVDPQTHIKGFGEFDFLGAAQTANSNQTNSYTPRVRQLYTNVDWDNWGLHLTAGQMWSLGTTNSGPIRADNYLNPPTIDAQYVPGFFFARQPGVRIEKDLPYDFSAALAVEGSSTNWANNGTLVANNPAGAIPFNITSLLPAACGGATIACAGPLLGAAGFGGGNFNSTNSYSFNSLPDFISKVAWDPTFFDRHIHVEGFGILRNFSDREYWGNHSVWAGGGGGSVIVPVLPKLFDVQVSGAFGSGIGRYGAGSAGAAGASSDAFAGVVPSSGINGWDASYGLSGQPLPIKTRMLLVGGTAHVLPTTDVYIFAGGEFNSQNWQAGWWGAGKTRTLFVSGFGSFLNNNTGCEIEAPSNYGLTNPASLNTGCAQQTKSVRQITTGIWHTLYAGDFGKLKVGAQYAYSIRDLMPGLGTSGGRGTLNTFYTSLRYYPF